MVTLNIGERWLMTLASAFLMMSWPLASAVAQPAGYTNLNVKGRVQLEIPDDWTINDAEHRKRIKDLSEKLTGIQATHTTSLSAQSFPTPSKMFVRVSFLALEPPLTPSEMRKEVQANRQQLVKELADMWKEESPIMWAGLAKKGVKEVGRASFAVESLGGQIALVIRYARTSINPTETVKVAQYHVPLGSEKALITLSYVDGNQGVMLAHDRLKKSIVIR